MRRRRSGSVHACSYHWECKVEESLGCDLSLLREHTLDEEGTPSWTTVSRDNARCVIIQWRLQLSLFYGTSRAKLIKFGIAIWLSCWFIYSRDQTRVEPITIWSVGMGDTGNFYSTTPKTDRRVDNVEVFARLNACTWTSWNRDTFVCQLWFASLIEPMISCIIQESSPSIMTPTPNNMPATESSTHKRRMACNLHMISLYGWRGVDT